MLEGQTKKCLNMYRFIYNNHIYIRVNVFFLQVFRKYMCVVCACSIETLIINHHLIPHVNSCSARLFDRQDGKLDLEKEITAAEETVQVGAKNPYSKSNTSDPGNIII